MSLLETISRWIQGRGSNWLESAPFEELVDKYAHGGLGDKREIYGEFARRFSRLVFRAAQDFAERRNVPNVEAEASKLKDKIFRSFVPHMAAGDQNYCLRRFAIHIRNLLDDKAFSFIARAFYYQLPVYHISNDEQRRILAAMLQTELSTAGEASYVEKVAQDFHISPLRATNLIKRANQQLEKIIANDFEADELEQFTEGYVP
jgi:hypothetical protein